MGAFAGFAGSAGKIVKKVKEKLAGRGGDGGDSMGAGEHMDKSPVPSYHKGGTVRKTGLARLRKGEKVLTKRQQQTMRKKMRGKSL